MRLMQMVSGGYLDVATLPVESADWLAAFYDRYSDREVQLADATLVYLAETQKLDAIFTLDRRDFSIYRLGNGRHLSIVPD